MGIATGNPTWEDFPSTNTPITADSLNRIEAAIDASMGVVHHTTADAPRPDYAAVFWSGELEPLNALPGDIWRDA